VSFVDISVPPVLSPDNYSYPPGQQSRLASDILPQSCDMVHDDISVPPAMSYPPGQQSRLASDILPQSSDMVHDDISVPPVKQTKVHN